MTTLTRSLDTKAEKIRALGRARVAPAEIARFLKIRYQQAYNVLKRSGLSADGAPSFGDVARPHKTTIDASGRIAIPNAIRQRWDIAVGEELLVALEGDELRVFTLESGVRIAQSIVAKHLRAGESLAEELIAERRREAAEERA